MSKPVTGQVRTPIKPSLKKKEEKRGHPAVKRRLDRGIQPF